MSGTFRVLVADAIAREGLSPLASDARFELVERPGLTGEALADAIAGADAVLVRSATRITRDALAHADRLKVIGRAGVGVDTIDVEAATERGVAVLTAPSGNTISAAELAFALLLALVRRVAAADRSMRAGEWNRQRFTGTELYGKTLGLVGAGRVGSEVARRAQAFGMAVMAYDPFLSADRAAALEITLADLDTVLRAADVVSVHVPLTEHTAGLVDVAKLALMKRDAVLVNAARGGVVDEGALVAALRENRLAGAALDVFETEPLPADHPLRSLSNVVLTPHLGASTAEAQRNVAIEIAEAVRAALVDGDFSRAVNAPAVAGDEMRRLRSVLGLGERLGRLASALAGTAVQRVEVRCATANAVVMRPLAASVLVGVLADALGRQRVNLVNALHLAQARGITVQPVYEERDGPGADVFVRVAADGREHIVAGLAVAEGHTRVVRIDEFRVDVAPRGTLVVLRNRDVPGVIGRVGTLLGNAGINIAEYHQARVAAGGEALAAVSVDSRLPADVVAALTAIPEVRRVCQVELGA